MTAVRLSRLPCCERLGTTDNHGVYRPFSDGPRLQRLLYLNPGPGFGPDLRTEDDPVSAFDPRGSRAGLSKMMWRAILLPKIQKARRKRH